jgi:hypothetical protein
VPAELILLSGEDESEEGADTETSLHPATARTQASS